MGDSFRMGAHFSFVIFVPNQIVQKLDLWQK